MTIPDAVRKVLDSGALAHMVTLSADRSAQVSCVWVGVEGDEFVVASLHRNRKVQNIERNPQVVFSLATGRKASNGLDEYLVVRGHARVVPGGAPEVLQRLAYVYVGPGVKFPAMPNPPPGYVIRIEPRRFSGNLPL